MDQSERKNNKRQSGNEVPRVPIKTYKWEDVRRSRRRGGYPWTYLNKGPFDEFIDPEDFTMDGLRKSKTSSASSASDSLDIKEITEDDIKGLENIDSSYVVIEGPILLGGQIEEPTKDQEVMIESAESSDNISQYLDKEDREPDQQLELSTETLTLPEPSSSQLLTVKERTLERAKSEEPKRKRKLSIESNYSRISLSKLGVMKRLRETKQKIKLPKLGGTPKPEKKTKPKPEEVQPETKREWVPKPRTNENPVYIHIPLKPPEGETDEFSYLEFEEKRPQVSVPPPPPPPEVQIEVTADETNEDNEENIVEPEFTEIMDENIKRSENNLGLGVPDDQEDDVSAIIFLEGDEEDDNKEGYDIMVVDIDENSKEMKMSQVTNVETRRQVLESIHRVESQAELAGSKQGSDSLSRTSSKTSKTSKASIRKRRAKSVEPEKKRRSSIDSSYSRKSLSKIGFIKKLKELHLPFTKSQSKKSVADTSSTKKEVLPVRASSEAPISRGYNKDHKPVYIHIPLKPPAGQTDQFSHLEFETAPPPKPKTETSESNEAKDEEEKSPIESPHSTQSPEFIFLIPPSDDELLDKPDIPETPSSETGSLFQFGELKQLAKRAVDQIQGALDSVDEEQEVKPEETMIVTEAIVETPREEPKDDKMEIESEEKVTIDEEDGLKSTLDETTTRKKSNLKGEASPLPKKKVSFKRRKPSEVSKDDGYEEIGTPSEISRASVSVEKDSESTVRTSSLGNSQSMSVDEEKSYLDSEKIVKSSSLKEDYNRWSKLSDHEYEPVNPPADSKPEVAPPKSHVSEVLNPSTNLSHQYSDDETLDLSVQEMQEDIENRFFNKNNTSTEASTTKSAEKRASSPRKSPTKRSSRSRSKEKEPAKPNKFQVAIKESASKFKTKLQGIKKPNISLPPRPKFQAPNIRKPNINLPKLPDLASKFRRTKSEEKKTTETASVEEKEEEKKEVPKIFDFSTFPRLFKKKKRDYDSGSLKGNTDSQKSKNNEEVIVKKSRWEGRRKSGPTQSIRIPLHSEESMDQDNGISPRPEAKPEENEGDEGRSSPRRYQEDTDADDEDARQRERQEKHRAAVASASQPEESRWEHGSFYRNQNGADHHYDNEEEESEENLETYEREQRVHDEIVTDLDLPEETQQPFLPTRQRPKLQQNDSIDTNHSRDVGSSINSLGHRRGVIEEIDSDQFFLREKGISQDNIDMGKYLSTEIREAFRSPVNALADMRAYNYEEMRASNQSLPETKRKSLKKPKRRKTPHASQERLRYDQESENEDYNFMPPTRPRRRSKRRKRAESEVIPYADAISVEPPEDEDQEYPIEEEDNLSRHYENNQMEGKQQPDIRVSEPYKDMLKVHDSAHRRASEPLPAAPPRKHKSLKSLNASEHESIFEQYERDKENNNINAYANEDAFMSSQMEQTSSPTHHFNVTEGQAPRPPKRSVRSRSQTKSMSRATSQAETDSIFGRGDSIMFENESREPVVEEPCIKDLRDSMGYAIVDKNQNKNWEHKFCTVPRSQGGKDGSNVPERPLRNYSTLGPSRPPRKLIRNMTDEEKENIDITQYIEIEDERDLQSGEVIQKMQNRPLPAPPRPPRSKSKPLHDITSEANVQESHEVLSDKAEKEQHIDETEVSTQTEPLPADFVCEEMVREESDTIMTPSSRRKNASPEKVQDDQQDEVKIERVLITPTQFTYQEETITHGQLLVEPLNGAKILPDSELTKSYERIIPVTSDEETSEIPENFNNLSDPKQPQTNEMSEVNRPHPQKPPRTQNPRSADSVEFLKTQKLQVADLDVDRLTVNELIANKIIVSEIDSGNITSHEISSSSGALTLGDIKLEPSVVKKLLEQLQESSRQQQSILGEETTKENQDDHDDVQKKTSTDFRVLESSISQESTKTVISLNNEDSLPSDSNSNLPEFHHSLEENLSEPEDVSENIVRATKSETEFEDNPTKPTKLSSEIHEGVQNLEETKSVDLESTNPETSKAIDELSNEVEKYIQHSEDTLDSEPLVRPPRGIEELTTELQELEADDQEPPVRPPRNIEEFSREIQELEENPSIDIESNYQEPPVRPPRNIEESSYTEENVQQSEIPQLGSQGPPVRPPRSIEKKSNGCETKLSEDAQLEFSSEEVSRTENIDGGFEVRLTEGDDFFRSSEIVEPEVDDEPPPRPPQPRVPYVPSQPPASFYSLRAQQYVEGLSDDIPSVPRRKRQQRPPTISRSSSSESSGVPMPRRRVRSPEPSIPQLTGQLVGACSVVARNTIKRLIEQVNSKIASTTDTDEDSNRQNVQVIIVILLVLIAGLLLLGYGDGRTVHLHHWEYFNPPRNL